MIEVPRLLSFLATGTLDGKVDGLNQLQAAVRAAVRRRELHPAGRARVLGMRVMAYVGTLMFLVARSAPGLPQAAARAGALVHAQRDGRDRVPVHRRDRRLDPHRDGPPAVDRPGAAPDRGRALAERQRGHDRDEHRVFSLLYAALGVADIVLMRRYARVDPPDAAPPPSRAGTRDGALR